MRWEQVSIGDLFLKKSSNRKQKDLVSEGYPVFGASGLSGFAHDFDVQVPYFGVVKDGAGVGRVSVHPAESSVVGTMECLIPKPGLHFEFLGYCLRRIRFERYVTGSTIPHVYFKDYKNEMVALPPLEEQKRIAGILDEADRVRKKTQVLIDKYDELAQSLFLDMFGDPVTNPKGWSIKQGHEVYEVRGRVGWKGYKRGDLRDSGPLVLGATHIESNGSINLDKPVFLSREKFDESPEIEVRTNDLIFAQRGSIGEVGLVRSDIGEATINPVVLILRPTDALPEFLLGLLTNHKMRQKVLRLNSGSVQPMITQASMKELELPIPSVEDQRLFSVAMSNLLNQRRLAEAEFDQKNRLFKALLQKAFKGELT